MTKVMATLTPQLSVAGTSRRRTGSVKNETTSENEALNQIAKEAEARLAAKRVARAEARSIRMRELERRQSEMGAEGAQADGDAGRENRHVLMRSQTIAVRGDEDQILQSDIIDMIDQVSNEKQIVHLKESIRESEEKYKKAMMTNATLDNEKQALQYNVEILKDVIEDLQERFENTKDELVHKSSEYNKLFRDHQGTSAELKKCLFLLEDRERILDEHGINLDGTIKEDYLPPSTKCTVCSALIESDVDEIGSIANVRGRKSLQAEIDTLRNGIIELREINSVQSEHILQLKYNKSPECSNKYGHYNGSDDLPSFLLSSVDSDEKGNKNSSLKINIDNYISVNAAPSPTGSVASSCNLNVNKYFAGEEQEETFNEDGEEGTAFRLSRYFDSGSTSSATELDTVAISNEFSNLDNTRTNNQSRLNTNPIAREDFSSQRQTEVSKPATPDLSVEDIVTVENVIDDMISPEEFEEHMDIVSPLFNIGKKPSILKSRSDSEISLCYQILPGEEYDTLPDTSSMNTAFVGDDVFKEIEEKERKSSELDNNDNVALDERIGVSKEEHNCSKDCNDSLTRIIRNDVEELYNQIAGESEEHESALENFNSVFPSATLPSQGSETKGWKVWLENSLGQKNKQQENKSLPSNDNVVEQNEGSSDEKEKKKKKKKKKK